MTKKKVFSIISKTLTVAILVFTVLVVILTIFSVTAVGNANRSVFGYKAYIVQSNSMQGEFEAGDIVVSKVTEDVSDLEEGTIITFISTDPVSYGETVTHKIRKKIDYNGETAYITYGVATGSDDETPVKADKIIGVYSFHVPKIGYFFQFLKTPAGYITLILVPFLILIALNSGHFIKLVLAYKKEKAAKTEEERAIAENNAAEAKRLREEMDSLKAEMAARGISLGKGSDAAQGGGEGENPSAKDGGTDGCAEDSFTEISAKGAPNGEESEEK